VSYVNPKNSLRQIMKVLNMNEAEIKRVVYGLHQAGLVEIVRAQSVAKGTGSSSVPGRPNRPAKPQSQPDKKVINKLIDKLKSI
jgi:hypothetical protein